MNARPARTIDEVALVLLAEEKGLVAFVRKDNDYSDPNLIFGIGKAPDAPVAPVAPGFLVTAKNIIKDFDERGWMFIDNEKFVRLFIPEVPHD